MAREYAEGQLDENSQDSPAEASDDCPFKLGDFVAVVEEGSTLSSPKILIGQLHAFVGRADVSLLWYKNISPNLYKLELSGGQWTEGVGSLVPVSLKAAKNRPGVYRLTTSPRRIHKAVMEK